ncbi:MAG: PIN domain-containing protein [Mycobacteriales bacterium]
MDRGNSLGGGFAIAALVVDAGPLYAYVDADEAPHAASRELLETHPGRLIVPMLVISEVVDSVGARLGPEPEVRFLGDLADGAFSVEPVVAADWLRIAELVARTVICRSAPWTHRSWPRLSEWAYERLQPSTAAASPSCGPTTSRRSR